jgi:hypothetical protein
LTEVLASIHVLPILLLNTDYNDVYWQESFIYFKMNFIASSGDVSRKLRQKQLGVQDGKHVLISLTI